MEVQIVMLEDVTIIVSMQTWDVVRILLKVYVKVNDEIQANDNYYYGSKHWRIANLLVLRHYKTTVVRHLEEVVHVLMVEEL